MLKIYPPKLLLVLLTSLCISNANAQCGINLLTNPGFDSPVQPSIGNNLTGLFTFNGWTMVGGPFNVIRTDGTVYSGGPDNALSDNQYVDVTSAAGTIYQDFTITGTSVAVDFGGYFSSRESAGYVNWTASIEVYEMPANTLVATSNTRNFTSADGGSPAQENWYFISGNATLNTGTYRYVVNLGDYGNFDGAFAQQTCTLPVVLSNFSGQYQDNKVRLNWKTAQQNNFSHFEVERSANGAAFSAIGNVNKNSGSDYTFTDAGFVAGAASFYRLRMVDKDGGFKFSSIIKIRAGQTAQLSVMPNPVADYLTVSGLAGKGRLKVVDAAGKVMVEKTIQAQSLSMDISFLHSGMYFLQYIDGSNVTIQKIFKQ
jgi:Secretion system C-terminal sorting domain